MWYSSTQQGTSSNGTFLSFSVLMFPLWTHTTPTTITVAFHVPCSAAASHLKMFTLQTQLTLELGHSCLFFWKLDTLKFDPKPWLSYSLITTIFDGFAKATFDWVCTFDQSIKCCFHEGIEYRSYCRKAILWAHSMHYIYKSKFDKIVLIFYQKSIFYHGFWTWICT